LAPSLTIVTRKNIKAMAASAHAIAMERNLCRRFASASRICGVGYRRSQSFNVLGTLSSEPKAMIHPKRAENRKEVKD
jgi:hypothetical protein